MEQGNVKMMALVPMNMTQNLAQQHLFADNKKETIPALHTNPELMRLKNLETDLLATLNETSMDPEYKMGRYIELLNKHATVLKSVSKPMRIDFKGPINKPAENAGLQARDEVRAKDEDEGEQHVEREMSRYPEFQAFMDKLSTVNRIKARTFLSHLEKNPNIKWDMNNTVSVNGKKIKNSNIWTIFSDFFTNRQKTSAGFSPVAYELMDSRVRKSTFLNRKAFDKLQRSKRKPRRNAGLAAETGDEVSWDEEGDNQVPTYKERNW